MNKLLHFHVMVKMPGLPVYSRQGVLFYLTFLEG